MRKKVMAANWKMYKTPDQASEFFRTFLPMVAGYDRDEIVVCPPFLDIPAAVEAVKGSPLSERTQLFGQQIGIALLVVLMSLAFYNDISRHLN